MSVETKLLNMLIPIETHTAIKVIAAEENSTMKSVIIKAIERYKELSTLKHQIYRLKYDAHEKDK